MIQMMIIPAFAALGSIMMLTILIKLLFHAHDLILFPVALALGLFYTAFVEQRSELVEGASAAGIYALSAYGLYMIVKKLLVFYRHSKEGPYQ